MCVSDWQCLTFTPDRFTGDEIRLLKEISQIWYNAFLQINDNLNKCFKQISAHFLLVWKFPLIVRPVLHQKTLMNEGK